MKARTRLASLKNLCSAEQDHILMLTVHIEVLIWLEELNGLLEQRRRLSCQHCLINDTVPVD